MLCRWLEKSFYKKLLKSYEPSGQDGWAAPTEEQIDLFVNLYESNSLFKEVCDYNYENRANAIISNNANRKRAKKELREMFGTTDVGKMVERGRFIDKVGKENYLLLDESLYEVLPVYVEKNRIKILNEKIAKRLKEEQSRELDGDSIEL